MVIDFRKYGIDVDRAGTVIPLHEKTVNLLSKIRNKNDDPETDYRMIVGDLFACAIVSMGTTITEKQFASEEEARQWWEAYLAEKREEWKDYLYLLPSPGRESFLQFCGMPAVIRGDVESTVGIVLRDGVPCGAIHSED